MQAVEFKVTLAGHTNTGKTSFVYDVLNTSRIPQNTLGVEVHPYDFTHDETRYRIHFWDCGGNTQHAGLGKQYAAGSALMVVFQDATKDNSIFQQQNIPVVHVSSSTDET